MLRRFFSFARALCRSQVSSSNPLRTSPTRPAPEALEDRTLPAPLTASAIGPQTVLPGTDILYTITVGNPNSSSRNVTLSDTLPSSLTLLTQQQTSGPAFTQSSSGNTVSDSFTGMAAGASATFDVIAQVNASLSTPTGILNTATASDGIFGEGASSNSVAVARAYDPVSLTNPGTQS